MAGEVEYRLIGASFAMGLLAACPIVWNYIFATVFTFATHSNWQSVLYTWFLPGVQIASIFCVVRFNFRGLTWLYLFNFFVAFFCFLSWSLSWSVQIVMPVLFVVNMCTLMIWLLVCSDVIYLCPEIYHKYYELGFLVALVVHYCLNQFELYLTNVMFIPFFACMFLGYVGFVNVIKHNVYALGKMRCKPIYYTKASKYITLTAWQVIDVALLELVLLWMLLLAMGAACIGLKLFTEVFEGAPNYMYLLLVGNFCCGSLMVCRGYIMTLVYTLVGAASFFFVLFGGYLVGREKMLMLTTLMFYCYFHANACLFHRIRKKMNRCVTTPRFILNICLLFNALLELTMLTANKLI
ncbi:hypothetical protein OvHV-2gp57 [Ovine gammaherpesvirus 2]|uniref:Envelope protein UL43 n=1 Tax=Ovine gammaherpesvirus 2 TaxID=10398 RepID=A1BM48_9GAMA|nr:hypothetical protein OvHV-2gp57 [Ovine gammaherpesvirus 2]